MIPESTFITTISISLLLSHSTFLYATLLDPKKLKIFQNDLRVKEVDITQKAQNLFI